MNANQKSHIIFDVFNIYDSVLDSVVGDFGNMILGGQLPPWCSMVVEKSVYNRVNALNNDIL